MRSWKIELRTDCKTCGQPLPNSRYRTFCCKKCREKDQAKKHSKSRVDWQRRHRAVGFKSYRTGRSQCILCGGWYSQVGSHVGPAHEMTAKEYRAKFGVKFIHRKVFDQVSPYSVYYEHR